MTEDEQGLKECGEDGSGVELSPRRSPGGSSTGVEGEKDPPCSVTAVHAGLAIRAQEALWVSGGEG